MIGNKAWISRSGRKHEAGCNASTGEPCICSEEMSEEMGGTVEVATMRIRDEIIPWSGGIRGGRVWHYRSTTWTGRHHLTACGKVFYGDWSPGYRNYKPKTCAKCEKVWAAQADRSDG